MNERNEGNGRMRFTRALLLTLALSPALAPAATLDFTERLRIDPAGTDAEFGQVYELAIAHDGTTFVADGGFDRIHVFGADAQYLYSFGQPGDGPGDLPHQLLRIALDPDDNLLVAGTRSVIGRLDRQGDLVGAVTLNEFIVPRTLLELPDGSIVIVDPRPDFSSEEPTPPKHLHVYGPDGAHLRSFAESSWWKLEYERRWARSLLNAFVTRDADGTGLLYLQGGPLELRHYAADGTLLRQTSEGLEGFVAEPNLPVVEGDTVTFETRGGRAWRVMRTPDGIVLVFASRTHPDDLDHDYDAEPDFTARRQNAVAAYDDEFDLRAESRGDDTPALMCADPRGGVWALETDDDGMQSLVWMSVRIVD